MPWPCQFYSQVAVLYGSMRLIEIKGPKTKGRISVPSVEPTVLIAGTVKKKEILLSRR